MIRTAMGAWRETGAEAAAVGRRGARPGSGAGGVRSTACDAPVAAASESLGAGERDPTRTPERTAVTRYSAAAAAARPDAQAISRWRRGTSRGDAGIATDRPARALTNSLTVAKRCSGRLASARSMAAYACGGRSGRSSTSGGGGSDICLLSSSYAEDASNGTRRPRHWYATTPSEYWSAAPEIDR